MRLVTCALPLLALLLLTTCRAFYIPGVAPTEFTDGTRVDVKVRRALAAVFAPEYKSKRVSAITPIAFLCEFF